MTVNSRQNQLRPVSSYKTAGQAGFGIGLGRFSLSEDVLRFFFRNSSGENLVSSSNREDGLEEFPIRNGRREAIASSRADSL